MEWILWPAMAFVVGSVPFGRIIGKAVARVDVREVGSRNIGATNVAREVGTGWGVGTLILDAFKGAAPVLTVGAVGPAAPGLAEVSGLAAVVGHQYSPFLGFRGGKGVATALGVFLALEPAACLPALGVFVGVVLLWDMVSLGSISAACTVPATLMVLGGAWERVAVSVAVAGLIVFAHRENLARIARGTERRWSRDRKR